MGLLDGINHLLNFVAPALAVALMMPLLGRLVVAKGAARPAYLVQAAVVFGVGLAVLLAALWFWEHDGKMLGYAAMVVACATAQWLMQRAWVR